MFSMLCPKAAQLRSLFGTDKMPKCCVLRIPLILMLQGFVNCNKKRNIR